MTTAGHNSEGLIESFVDRLERLDEERRALASDMKDLMDEAASSTGFSKVSFRNILKERRTSRAEVHATYVEMDAIRRALKMRDPLLPPDEPQEAAAEPIGEVAERIEEAARRSRERVEELERAASAVLGVTG